jgi:hypothetical protein
MANDDPQAHRQPPQPGPDLKILDRLVGAWEVSGGAQGRVTYEWMEGGYFWRSIGMPQEMVEAMRHTPRWAELEAMAPTMVYDSEIMGDVSTGGAVPTDLAGRVRTETLILVGGASPAWMIDVGRQVADALPNGQHRVMEGQEHVVPPELLVPVLEEFFVD